MKPNDTLYIAQTDIKDYFYSIGLPEELRPYFTFPQVDLKKICPEDPRCRGVEGPVLIQPCMKVVPMGWNWAMYIAQRAHQHQAMLAAKVGVESVVVDGRPVPPLDEKNHTLLIPYADNLNIVRIDKQKVQNMKNVITDHMNSIGFITHEEQSAETRAEALGFLVDGQGGRILPRPHKRDRARKVLLWLARQPKVSGQMIERVIGHCIHFFMLRRECLSVFRAIYDFKQAHYSDRVTLWKTAAEECRQAAALLLVCYADLKREWHSEVTCSDASLTGTGVCAATFDVQQVCYHGSQRELWRYKSKDAAHNARDHFAKADPFSDISTVSKISAGSAWDDFQINDEFVEIPRSLLQSSEWETLFSSRMQMPEHITLLEGRGVVQTLRHKTRAQNSFHKRHLHLGDNLGMTLCLDRGRAKNKQLLFQCRRVAAFNIAADIEVHHRWIPSELNPADAPSRRYEGEAHEVSKRQKKKVIESILYPDRANHFETEEAGKILETLKATQKPYRGLNQLARPADTRRKIQDMSEVGRAQKRKRLMEEHDACPRHGGQSFLEQAAVSPRTARDYQFRIAVFHQFCRLSKLSIRSAPQIDTCLTIFFEQCFKDGMSINEVTKFLAAIIDSRPELSSKHMLVHSRRALKGWRNLDPGTSRPPEAWPVVALLASKMVEANKVIHALFILTMFATYCRPFELLQLQKRDLVESRALGTQWSLVLNKSEDMEQSKTGMQDESMVLDNKEIPWLGMMLKMIATKQTSSRLFNIDYHELRESWKKALKSANLPDGYMVIYQLRHSGASWDRSKGYRSQLEVKHQGRWASDTSMLRYEKHAMVMQRFTSLSPKIQRGALAATQHLKEQCDAAAKRLKLGLLA